MRSTSGLLVTILVSLNTVYRVLAESCCDHDAGFDPKAAGQRAQQLARHSWEYGTVAEALLELYNPRLSVFSPQAFPAGEPPDPDPQLVPALAYAKRHIRLHNETLVDGDGASGDPASLGVSALMIGQTDRRFMEAAKRQFEHLERVPTWENGAISHREDYAELWSDFVYMAPPFMAYYAVATNSTETIKKALMQCLKYRQVMRPNVSSESVSAGAWQHIVGPNNEDRGLWSTGNGWAAMGMARVLATLLHWPPTAIEADAQIAQADLFTWIGEILQAAMNSPKDKRLLRNYLNDTTWFGEVSGTAILTATVYRVAAMQEEASALFSGQAPKVKKSHPGIQKPVSNKMLSWADENLKAIAAQVQNNGLASPVVNPLGWGDRKLFTKGSPEGESFLIMLYAAWRDCVKAGACEDCSAVIQTNEMRIRDLESQRHHRPSSELWKAHTFKLKHDFAHMSKHPPEPLGLGIWSSRITVQRMLKRLRLQPTKTDTQMAANTNTPDPSRKSFFDLPAELRNAVYELFAADCPLTLSSKTGVTPSSLLLASRQCRDEYLPILLGTARIQVSITDMNFTKLMVTICGLSDGARKAMASNLSLLIVLRVKKCGSDVYANLRAWCQFQAQASTLPSTERDEHEAEVRPLWHYIIDPARETNAAQLDWYCGRVRVLKERSSDKGVRIEVQRILDVLEGERTGKSELGSWNMGFGDAYALYAANATRRT
ncbi:Putative six-hairpin glycosidase superfamily, glycosyl hydrolase, family 88 [Septoria linicola]|uniref:Six-hairpin glycosidase superfamily, glycosyl hydrolase, family 88 n=1 Tax=Septoria linicola TaxID=215465 RepID=A0A9Q9AKR7_9PEZI|nr:putative six-hairpin glycosidase superfamily, glycosyl hydrolase, family 88 [Septoria linicola]USW51124.1 Putative six-hairpin glycosidase superfamily, glycosyl hydrolase, family 88 [Septoria linicola]